MSKVEGTQRGIIVIDLMGDEEDVIITSSPLQKEEQKIIPIKNYPQLEIVKIEQPVKEPLKWKIKNKILPQKKKSTLH